MTESRQVSQSSISSGQHRAPWRQINGRTTWTSRKRDLTPYLPTAIAEQPPVELLTEFWPLQRQLLKLLRLRPEDYGRRGLAGSSVD